MRVSIVVAVLACSCAALRSQTPFSINDALPQLYRDYDARNATAQWACTTEQQKEGPHGGWQCRDEDATVSVSVRLVAQVAERDADRVYILTSAKPDKDPMGFDCHACAPATGAAVFTWKDHHWTLEAENVAVEFWGGWGEPPDGSLVTVGPQKHGFILSWSDEGQGFSSSSKVLLLPVGRTVQTAWQLGDESDDLGAVDPSDPLNKLVPYRSSAAFRFFAGDPITHGKGDYYDIEVISRGSDQDNRRVISENWTAIYRFKDGKFSLARRTTFTEIKKRSHTRGK